VVVAKANLCPCLCSCWLLSSGELMPCATPGLEGKEDSGVDTCRSRVPGHPGRHQPHPCSQSSIPRGGGHCPSHGTYHATITPPRSRGGLRVCAGLRLPVHMYVPVTLGRGGSVAGPGMRSKKGGLVFSYSRPRTKCILQFQWQVGERHTHYCRGATRPSPHQRGQGRRQGRGGGIPGPQASPIPRIGRDDPDRKPSFCSSRLSKSARSGGGEVRRRKRLPEPSLLRSIVQMGLPGDPTRAQPWNLNLRTAQFTNTCVVGTPRGGHFGQL